MLNSASTAVAPGQKFSQSTLANGKFLQRKCACGNHTPAGGECTSCAAKKLQKKLSIGSASDPLEAEADRVADQVLSNKSTHAFSNLASPKIQRRATPSSAQADEIPASVEHTLSSIGSPLPHVVRRDMEQRFNQDFSCVRIHTDGNATQSARDINANAYTAGNNIVFDSGKFSPESQQGKHLLAHELTHVVQQGGVENKISRQEADKKKQADASDASAKKLEQDKLRTEAEILEKKIWGTNEYKKLPGSAKANVMWIVSQAKKKPLGDAEGQRNYYLKKLMLAISTKFEGKDDCTADNEKENRDAVNDALGTEKLWGGAFSDLDEIEVAKGKNITKRKGENGKIFTVDRSDPRNILVKMKVKLNGPKADVKSIKSLEDAVERSVSMSTKGYHLDIEFVDKKGADVFEFTVKFCEWPNSGNWASSPIVLSHEAHHALGLGDRYDYIESHSDNEGMSVPTRLIWFVEQMKKTKNPRDPFSKMDKESNPLLAEDVCSVAFDAGTERDKCIAARKDLDPTGIPPI